jgi:hypothetical protein
LVVISQTESSGSVTTKSSSESEKDDVFGIPSVFGRDEGLEVGLRYVWFAFMINVEE